MGCNCGGNKDNRRQRSEEVPPYSPEMSAERAQAMGDSIPTPAAPPAETRVTEEVSK
jgi:hypothetical protein